MAADESLEGDRQTCGQSEDLGLRRQDEQLIADRLATEETLRRDAHDTATDAILAEQLGTLDERGDL